MRSICIIGAISLIFALAASGQTNDLPSVRTNRPYTNAYDSTTEDYCSLVLHDVPLQMAAMAYASFVDKKVKVKPGVNARITVDPRRTVSRIEAVSLLEKAFADAGVRISVVDPNTVQLER